jgi:TonB family protein
MIIALQNNLCWQEWSFRVGCWLLIVGVHLWLLFLLPQALKTPEFSWADSQSGYSSLALEFVAIESHAFSNKSGGKLSSSSSDNYVDPLVSGRGIEKTVVAEVIKKSLVHKSDRRQSHKEKGVVLTNPLEIDARPTQEITKKTSAKTMVYQASATLVSDSERNEIIENNLATTESVDRDQSLASSSDSSKIIYNPSLSAPPVSPSYPEVARRKKQEGTVWLDIFLDENGQQKKLSVYKSSGVSLLDKAAVYAVKQWRFSQYQYQSQQQYAADLIKIRIPIEFSLN